MKILHRQLEIASSPHVTSGASVDVIMRSVTLALAPVCVFAIYAFGIAVALVLAVAVVSCMATEHVARRVAGQPSSLGDWSVAVTGLLYGLTLPPGLPLWMVAVGGVFGVGVAKVMFGGLGSNAFNPALVGRAFLQAAFPQAMTHWTPLAGPARFTDVPTSTLALPFAQPTYDAVTAATPLAALKFEGTATDTSELLLGMTAGSAGETCALLILAGGAYLVARRMMNWRIPIGIFGAVAALSAVFTAMGASFPAPPGFMLFSGGLVLGAVFMATDPVASPLTNAGCWLFGALIGFLVVVIRLWGGMPEGVMYAILLANAVSPHIDRAIQPRVFGSVKS
ncbi:MAG: RnfABCDGE type electron transport complex subunit D [Pseudomonadota bacterium]